MRGPAAVAGKRVSICRHHSSICVLVWTI